MSRFRWGVLGTGFAARRFAQGLRNADDAEVSVVASRTLANAKRFADEFGVATATDSYKTAIHSRDVDAFHIATPPSMHREHTLSCIAERKPTLVEKPFAVDAAEALEIVESARNRSVFCMEAMWTRFLPLIAEVKRLVDEGEAGQIRVLSGSFGIAEAGVPGNNIYDANLGGGALLHRGVYPLSLAIHLLGPPDEISSQAVFGESGVDEDSAVILRYRSGSLAVFHSSLKTQSPNDLRVMGTRAHIHVKAPIFRPHRMVVTPVVERRGPSLAPGRLAFLRESPSIHRLYQTFGHLISPILKRGSRHVSIPYRGNGYNYEADEVKRCVTAGKTESSVMPLTESVTVMEAIDSIRSQWRDRRMSRPTEHTP